MSSDPNRITLDMTIEDAAAIADALSYYTMAAVNNYGAGYENTPEDREARRVFNRVALIAKRLETRVEKRQNQ